MSLLTRKQQNLYALYPKGRQHRTKLFILGGILLSEKARSVSSAHPHCKLYTQGFSCLFFAAINLE